MNTLPRDVTSQYFNDSQSYNALRKQWSSLMNSDRKHELTAAHHLLYLALLGKDWRKGFTFLSRPSKLANGGYYNWGLFSALTTVHSKHHTAFLLAPFEGTVTAEMLESVRAILPAVNLYEYRPEQFTNGNFPFEAYSSQSVPK